MGDANDSVGEPTGDTRRFAAFISYSHVNADAAAKLQRKLERYRLPKHIANARAGQSAAFGQIFRDRDDLAAAASLSAAIRDAIQRADALIVMCSPDAAASPWVTAEIALFQELHPEKPILAALLSGEPATAFPAALTANGNEPLAADLRPEGDGPQLGFLKIVAGIAGVPLDALIQRDAQRRIRRVTAITVSALAAMLIMGIMTAYAISARNEAARQRAEAEGLVEYMLTDLREKLRGVGRLDIMSAVNERAMAHYRRQGDLAALPADGLERRARILHAMGEDDEKQGNLDLALGKFEEAHRATAALLAQEPTNPERIFAHSQSEYWVGYIAYLRNDWPRTERHWGSYKEYADRLVRLDPENPSWLREAGYAEGNLCTLGLDRTDRKSNALASCEAALARMTEVMNIVPQDAQSVMDVANRHGWVAEAMKEKGNLGRERHHRLEQAKLSQKLLSEDPENRDLLDLWLTTQISIAKMLWRDEDEPERKKVVRNALVRADELAKADPSNKVWAGRTGQLQELLAKQED